MKKYLKTMTVCTLLGALLLSGCGKKGETPEVTLPSNNNNPIQDIVDDIIESNPDKVGKYVTPAENCFKWNSVDGGVKITSYTGKDTAIIVPSNLGGEKVVAIDMDAFVETSLTGIQLPDTLLKVEDQTFSYLTTLMEVSLGNGVQTIGDHAFEGCVALQTIELGSALEDIGLQAFGSCQSLKQITFPEGMKSIQAGSFCMSGLESVVIPGSVVELGDQAFSTCSNLKSVEIKDGVTVLGKKVFEACSALETAKLPSSITEFGIRVFSQSENVTVIAPAGSAAETYANENEVNFKAT